MIVKLLQPGTHLMGRLSHPLKFLVISTLFILPFGVVLYFLIIEADEKIRFAQMEKRGTEYLRPLRHLMQDLPLARLEEYRAGVDTSLRPQAQAARNNVDNDLALLVSVDKRYGAALETSERAALLSRDWESLKTALPRLSAIEKDKRYIRLILQLRALITHAGNTSHLILEPDLDTYYLSNALLLRSPENMDTLAQLRIITRYVLDKKGISTQGRAEFYRLYNTTENNLYEMQKGMEFIRRPGLERLMKAQNAAVMTFLRAFDENIVRASAVSGNISEMDALGHTALDATFRLWDGAVVEMEARIDRRIFDLGTKKNLTRGFYILALLAAAYFWLGFYHSVMNTISDLESAEKRLMSGDFGTPANPDTRDELRRIVYSFNNLANRLRIEREQLIQVAKLESVGRLAAGIAHEVKNPLAVLLQGIDFIAMQPEAKKEPYPELIADMRHAVSRADGVIRGLLDFSAPKELFVKDEDLNRVLEDSLLLVRHEMKKSNVKLECALSPALTRVPIDRNKIEQVLINLFTNACHAMPNGGTLMVRTSMSDSGRPPQAVITIEDTGSGIPADKLLKVFDPFFTTKPTGKGTGLGLSVVRSIIEMHKGSIELANRPSGGVRATVTLPLS